MDYGTENEVDFGEIRKLHREFYALPVQAVLAALHGIVPKPKGSLMWCRKTNNFIYELCFEKKFDVDIVKIDKSVSL